LIDAGVNAVSTQTICKSTYPVLMFRGIVAVADEQLHCWHRSRLFYSRLGRRRVGGDADGSVFH
jgi:hypothetical protein